MLFSLPFLNQIPLLPFYEEAVYRSKILSLLLSLINLGQNTFQTHLALWGFLMLVYGWTLQMEILKPVPKACISREGHMYLL